MDMIYFNESANLKYSRSSRKQPPWKFEKVVAYKNELS